MEVRRLRTLALETIKTWNDSNAAFMKNLFAKREVSKRRKNNLETPNRNTAKYGDKTVRSLGPHIWNGHPEEHLRLLLLFICTFRFARFFHVVLSFKLNWSNLIIMTIIITIIIIGIFSLK